MLVSFNMGQLLFAYYLFTRARILAQTFIILYTVTKLTGQNLN